MYGSAFDNLLREPRRRDPEEIEIPPNGISLDLLRAIYRSKDIPLSVRMRAAGMALPHEVPRLMVSAQVSENDFATLLDQRIKRYEEMRMVEQQRPAIETKSPPATPPAIADRRFLRRI
jgi:hypothetical protein